MFIDGVFETQNRADARHVFRNAKSAILRERFGRFFVFSPASASIGHFTAEVKPNA